MIRLRHFDLSVGKVRRELVHGVFFAVNEECTLCAGLLLPGQQFGLVGMGGEAVDGIDARPDRNVLAENAHLLGAVDDVARERATGCVADEYDARIVATEIVLQVMAHTAAGAHAGAGHDDGAAVDAVYRDGFGGLPREMQSRQSKRIASLLKQLRALPAQSTPDGAGRSRWPKSPSANRGTPASISRGDPSDAVAQVIEQLLRALQREGRDDDVSSAFEGFGYGLVEARRWMAPMACAAGLRRWFPSRRFRRVAAGRAAQQQTTGVAQVARKQHTGRWPCSSSSRKMLAEPRIWPASMKVACTPALTSKTWS